MSTDFVVDSPDSRKEKNSANSRYGFDSESRRNSGCSGDQLLHYLLDSRCSASSSVSQELPRIQPLARSKRRSALRGLRRVFSRLIIPALVGVLFSSFSYAAVTQVGTPAFVEATTDIGTTEDLNLTVGAGTSILVCSFNGAANGSKPTGLIWSGDENFGPVGASVSTDAGDAYLGVWALVSPTVETGVVAWTFDGAVSSAAFGCVGYGGSVTSSVAAATNIDTFVENVTASSTTVLSSFGSAGNAYLALGSACGSDMSPASNASSFTERADSDSGGAGSTCGTTGDNAYYFADNLTAPAAVTVTWSTSDENAGVQVEIVAAATGPSYSSGPTLSAVSGGYRIAGTITGENATVYFAAYNPGASAPADCDALQTAIGSMTPVLYGSEAWTADAADTLDITGTVPPRHDLYHCAEGASGQIALASSANQDRSADSGQTIAALTAVSAPFDVVADYDPDVAIGDVVEHDSLSDSGHAVSYDNDDGFIVSAIAATHDGSNNASVLTDSGESWVVDGLIGFTLTNSTDGSTGIITDNDGTTVTLSGGLSGGTDDDFDTSDVISIAADARLSFNYNIQDVSITSVGNFTTIDGESCPWASCEVTLYVNNAPPDFSALPSSYSLVLGSPFAADLTDFCVDADSDTVTFAVDASSPDSLPTGLSLSGTGNRDVTGTPSDTQGKFVIFSCTDGIDTDLAGVSFLFSQYNRTRNPLGAGLGVN